VETPFVVMVAAVDAAAAPDAGNSGSNSIVDVGSGETAVTIATATAMATVTAAMPTTAAETSVVAAAAVLTSVAARRQ
jgi:sarcosine oxidase gamma subunit